MKELQEKAQALGIELQVEGKDKDEKTLTAEIKNAEKNPEKTPEELEEEEKEKVRKVAIAKVKKAAKKSEKTIEVLKSLSGKFLLSHTVGEFVNMDAKLAHVICEANYGKEV